MVPLLGGEGGHGGLQVEKQPDIETDRLTNREEYVQRQVGLETVRQVGRQTDRQDDWHSNRQTGIRLSRLTDRKGRQTDKERLYR